MSRHRLIIRNKNAPVCILYFHGLFATPGFWLPCIKSEFDFSHVFINYDSSDFLNETDGFLADVSSTVDNFLRDCTYEKVYIFGHSLGARIAQLIPFDIPRVYLAPVVRTSSVKLGADRLCYSFPVNDKSISGEGLVERLFSNKFFSFDIDSLAINDYVFQPISDHLTDLILLPSDNVKLYQGGHFTLPNNRVIFEHVKH